MRKFGLYLPGGVDGAMQFFAEKKPQMTACQVYLAGPQRYYPPSKLKEDETAKKVRDWQQEKGVEIVVHAPYVISIVNHKDKAADCIKRHLEILDKCGMGKLVVHSGSWAPDTCQVSTWLDFLEKDVKVQNYRSTICLENMPYTGGKAMTAEQLEDVHYQAPENEVGAVSVSLCFDTVHSWVGDGTTPDIRPHAVSVVHFNQTASGRGSGHDRHSEHHMDDTGTIPLVLLKNVAKKYESATIISEYDGPEWEKELELVREALK